MGRKRIGPAVRYEVSTRYRADLRSTPFGEVVRVIEAGPFEPSTPLEEFLAKRMVRLGIARIVPRDPEGPEDKQEG